MCFGSQLLIWDASEAEQPKEKRKPPTCAALQAKKTCTRQRQHKQRTQPPPSPPGNTCNPLTVMLPHYVMIKKKKLKIKAARISRLLFALQAIKTLHIRSVDFCFLTRLLTFQWISDEIIERQMGSELNLIASSAGGGRKLKRFKRLELLKFKIADYLRIIQV